MATPLIRVLGGRFPAARFARGGVAALAGGCDGGWAGGLRRVKATLWAVPRLASWRLAAGAFAVIGGHFVPRYTSGASGGTNGSSHSFYPQALAPGVLRTRVMVSMALVSMGGCSELSPGPVRLLIGYRRAPS